MCTSPRSNPRSSTGTAAGSFPRPPPHSGTPGSFEVILLDVDNGPGYLVHEANAGLYRRDFLTACHRALSAHGITAIWSADPSPPLRAAMREVFDTVEELGIPVTLGNRTTSYHLFIGRRGPKPPRGGADQGLRARPS